MERLSDEAEQRAGKEKGNHSREQREGEIGHNHCNQLNKAFLCLGPKKCTWKHLLILQEAKSQPALEWI